MWAPADEVFPIEFCNRLKELLPHAEGPVTFDRARHFLQDDRGRRYRAKTMVEFLNRRWGRSHEIHRRRLAQELSYLRADPLLWEQELDVRPDVAEAVERATGIRAGRVYWRSKYGHLYALELADLGRGSPSMARSTGIWDRFEPRPPEHEIDDDLLSFLVVGGARLRRPQSGGHREGGAVRGCKDHLAGRFGVAHAGRAIRGICPVFRTSRSTSRWKACAWLTSSTARATLSCCCMASRPGAISIAT